MTENRRFVSATGVELWLSPENTWGFPRKETYDSMHGCWKDLVVPNEIEDHNEVEPWSWFLSLFNGKARTRSVKRTFKLPRRKVMLTTVLKQMIEVGWLSVEESVTFDVFEVKPGLLHIEMRDDMEGWTAGEILDLPGYLWVGQASLRDLMLKTGLDDASVDYVLYLRHLDRRYRVRTFVEFKATWDSEAAMRRSKRSWARAKRMANGVKGLKALRAAKEAGTVLPPASESPRPGQVASTSTGQSVQKHWPAMVEILIDLCPKDEQARGEARRFLEDPARKDMDFSRVMMEVVSVLCNAFCYSACCSTSEQFKKDVIANRLKASLPEIYDRLTNLDWNEVDVPRGVVFKNKSMFFSPSFQHMSRYRFTFPDCPMKSRTFVELVEPLSMISTGEDDGDKARSRKARMRLIGKMKEHNQRLPWGLNAQKHRMKSEAYVVMMKEYSFKDDFIQGVMADYENPDYKVLTDGEYAWETASVSAAPKP